MQKRQIVLRGVTRLHTPTVAEPLIAAAEISPIPAGGPPVQSRRLPLFANVCRDS